MMAIKFDELLEALTLNEALEPSDDISFQPNRDKINTLINYEISKEELCDKLLDWMSDDMIGQFYRDVIAEPEDFVERGFGEACNKNSSEKEEE